MKINILILNYNGIDLLKECLPSVVEASKKSSYSCSVTVVDNCSTDKSIEFLKSNFKEVNLIESKENKVLCSYNSAISTIDDDLVVMLNNDIKVEPDFIDPLVRTFLKHDDAFLVGPKCLSFDKKIYEGIRAKPFFRMGLFTALSRYSGYEKDVDRSGLTAQSPFGVFDRRKFVNLNGFDEMYLPGIMEEADLCYRAYKKGYRCYYEPRSIIYHMGQVTFKRYYKQRDALILAHRNSFLFIWKNISDFNLILKHIFLTPIRLVYSTLFGKIEVFLGFIAAIKMFPVAIRRRKEAARLFKNSDRRIFNELKENLIFKKRGKANEE